MLEKIDGLPGCLFVTAPDVVGDAQATDDLWEVWSHVIHMTSLPAAYVAQDGCTKIPDNADVLFIGGTTEFKMSDSAAELVRDFDGWTHMGRVNSWRRLEYAMSLGIDSVDGTSFSMFTDRWLPKFSEMASSPSQGGLFE
jgi:hypothetical protein